MTAEVVAARKMIARSLEQAVRPDVLSIADTAGLQPSEVSALVGEVVARKQAALSPRVTAHTRAVVLLRSADALEAQARTLRRLALDDPACAGLICPRPGCGFVAVDKPGLARHTTTKHREGATQ